MRRIRELDDTLSNKISAGEVVERPASVVKELVENAIDGGSTIIEIDVEEAGLSSIRVIDNGQGILEEDIRTAFKRHATSKIKDQNDLFRIRTLGFRGEALPSIASVSIIDMTTSTGENAGARIVLEGGKLITHEKAQSRKGTDITVSGLFFNTPARLKYMKTINTELGNITDVVNRLALAHPTISFRLRHQKRILLQTTGSGNVQQVLAAIYGMNIAKKMIPISASSLDFQVSGFAALPEITRASRNYISTMINGRFIKNYSLVRAILEGYHTLLPIGRFPIVLLTVDMDPLLVDVNVHPSKLEVRLSKEKELNELVTEAIKSAFMKQQLIPTGFTTPKEAKKPVEQTSFTFQPRKEKLVSSPSFSYEKEQLLPPTEMKKLYEREDDETDKAPVSLQETPVFPEVVNEPLWDEEMPKEQEDSSDEETASRVPTLYPIGQMHGTYIFAQNERGLYILDQHAAQERIKYEYFREKLGQVDRQLQEMLLPLTLEFSTDDYLKIVDSKEALEQVGVFLEPFGQHSFIVRSHPHWFPAGKEKELIEEMIEQVLAMKTVDIKKLREEVAIMMSCKAAIKANRHLRNDEIQALLDELQRTSDPFTCPHGRPIIIHYSTYEMEKMFKRVM